VPGVGDAGEQIREEVSSWPGVNVLPHRFGGIEYRYGRKEMGHVHGDRLADLPFPRKLHDELIANGLAQPHHVLPDTGWVSRWMTGPGDAAAVIELFRLQYDRYASKDPCAPSPGPEGRPSLR
jgi:Luciferase